MTHDCKTKGKNTYCPKCGRSVPDVCPEKEVNVGLLESVAETVSTELADVSVADEPKQLTPIEKARAAKAAKRKPYNAGPAT